MKTYYLFLIFAFCLSCSEKQTTQQDSLENILNSGTKTDPSIMDTNIIKTILSSDSLKLLFYQIENNQKEDNKVFFSSLDDFPKVWVGVSQNSLGYFIYHREELYDEQITLSNGQWIKKAGIGTKLTYPIRSFTKESNRKYKFELGKKKLIEENDTYAICTFEIIDQDTLYAIKTTRLFNKSNEQVGTLQGLYIPENKTYLFRHIDEPNGKSIYRRVPLDFINIKDLN